MIGFEDEPTHSAEICICEIFGRDVGSLDRVGMDVHPFGDPAIRDEFAAETVGNDARGSAKTRVGRSIFFQEANIWSRNIVGLWIQVFRMLRRPVPEEIATSTMQRLRAKIVRQLDIRWRRRITPCLDGRRARELIQRWPKKWI